MVANICPWIYISLVTFLISRIVIENIDLDLKHYYCIIIISPSAKQLRIWMVIANQLLLHSSCIFLYSSGECRNPYVAWLG